MSADDRAEIRMLLCLILSHVSTNPWAWAWGALTVVFGVVTVWYRYFE